jgi:hypothetical protein
VSRVVPLLGVLRVFAVILSLCTKRDSIFVQGRIGRPPAEPVWEGPFVACIAITESVVARSDRPAVGRKR